MTRYEKELADVETRMADLTVELDELDALDELTEDQAERYDEIVTEAADCAEERIDLYDKLEKREAAIKAVSDPQTFVAVTGDGAKAAADPMGEPREIVENRKLWDLDEITRIAFTPGYESELRSRALTAIEKVSGLSDLQRSYATNLLESYEDDSQTQVLARHILAVSAPEYQKMFSRAVRTFGQTGIADPEAIAYLQRQMSLTDAAGGFAVPLPIDPSIVSTDAGSVNPFRAISDVITISTDQIRFVTANAIAASYDAEAAEVSSDEQTFASVDITVRKAQAFVPFSIEIGQDFPNLTAYLGGEFQRAKDNLEATVFATGTAGANQPIGIVTALTGSASEVASNGADAFALSDVYDLEEELPAMHRTSAVWTANKRIYQAMREEGGANLDDFWANLGQGQPSELLGYQTFEASAMDGVINAAAENYVLIFGDFFFYKIVERAGMSVELVPHVIAVANNRPSGQRGLYAWWRNGADDVNVDAFRMLNVT